MFFFTQKNIVELYFNKIKIEHCFHHVGESGPEPDEIRLNAVTSY